MCECMEFPKTFDEFAEQYKTTDTKHVYSNGVEFIPIYRVKQWLDHIGKDTIDPEELRPKGRCKFCEDLDWMYDVVCYIPNENGSETDIPVNFCPNCGAKMEADHATDK